MPALGRTSSTCSTLSNSSSCSNKSVSFDEEQHVFYTHSSNEYDRTATEEASDLRASLGRIYLSGSEQADIENSQQDTMVERNTFANGRRNSAGYAVVLNLRTCRSFSP